MTNRPPSAANPSSQQNGRPFTPGHDQTSFQTWQTGWTPLNLPMHASGTQYQHQQYPQYPYPSYQTQPYPQSQFQSQRSFQVNSAPPKPKSPSPTPSPPPPEFHRHWDAALRSFLVSLGLTQALQGFEADMLVLNSEWEQSKVPGALDVLVKNLTQLGQSKGGDDEQECSLDDRKLNYVHLTNGAEPCSQTSINKSISTFLAQNRARNDASNRDEFLHSIAQKRRRLTEADSDSNAIDTTLPSCARTDAKPVDRDVQMKYDIAKNEEGPLRRTVKDQSATPSNKKGKQKLHTQLEAKEHDSEEPKTKVDDGDDTLTPARQPGLDDRLKNIETHLSVRYVPAVPRTLLARLKLLEDHIVRLEKDYPPWAALHFNQPNRGWPPQPRPTPIIVPPHLRPVQDHPTSARPSLASQEPASTSTLAVPSVPETLPSGSRPRHSSSLHRAVMERLEVQKAMSDLAGVS